MGGNREDLVRRAFSVLLGALLLVAVSGCGESPAQKAKKPVQATVKSDWTIVVTGKLSQRRLGSYRYYHLDAGPDTSYEDAVETFGKPSSRGTDDPESNLCSVRWRNLGLEMGYANAPPEPCALAKFRTGAWYGATIYSRRWRTERGLRVGDSVTRLKQLYPEARFRENAPPNPPDWGLVWEGKDETAGYALSADVWDGRVVAIVVAPGYIF